MLTPYNPLRGVDLYVDASGEDDWDVEHDRYYLHGFMWTGPSEEWLAWMNAHKTKYEGLVHWANGEFGKDNKKLPNKKEACRGLLSSHPWSQTGIYVFDKKLFKEFVADRYGRKPTRYEIVKRVWKIMGVSYLNQLVPHLKKLVPEE
jgi:hypothetical protein